MNTLSQFTKNNTDVAHSNVLFSTPILFIIFNRPDTTERVFNEIKKIKPPVLYISADGPRTHKQGEEAKCEETKKIVEYIDWPCEIKRKYSATNLGCKVGVSSAINWFFEGVEEGIILEDDCLPNQSFFYFCQELLNKYKNTDKIKMISGSNLQPNKKYGDASYYFSNFPQIWGWATWKRAWREYDISMQDYPDFKKNNRIKEIFKDKKIQKYFINIFDKLYNNKVNTWDGQWAYSIFKNGGVSVIPNVNLVSNIGFGEDATHTKMTNHELGNTRTEKLENIIHPKNITINDEADNYIFNTMLYSSFIKKVLTKIKSYLNM